MPVLQQCTAPRQDPVIAVPGRRRRRWLLLLPVAAVLVAGSLVTIVPAASAAGGRALHFRTLAGAVTRADRASQRTPEGPSATPPGASRVVPLLSPDPARLRRVKERAARSQGGAGPAPQTLSPLPRATLFGGLNEVGMAADASSGTPPDTTGAIGPSHYLEFVNSIGITAYDRELNAVSGPVPLAGFIGFPADKVFDPQIQWDESWGRWVYAMDDIAEVETGPGEFREDNYLAFGWSKSADPTNLSTESPGGGWCGYFIYTGEEFDDYPKLGHSDTGITIGTNVFDLSAEKFLTSRIWSIAKPPDPATCPEPGAGSVASVGSAAEPLKTEDGNTAFTPVPANTADSSANSYVVAADSPFFTVDDQIMAWHVSGAGKGATLVKDGNMGVGVIEFPANVPQEGTAEVLDSLDARLTNAVAVTDPDVGQEAVWTQHTVNGPGGRSVVRWYELLPDTQTVRQEGTISDLSHFVFNGAISPAKQGDSAAIDYNRGSATLFPEMHAQSRDRGTPLGTMEGDVLLGESAGVAQDFSCKISKLEPCRWGDYAGASPDPVVPGVVWGSNQGLAAPQETKARWTTRNFALLTDLRAPAAPTISGTDPAGPANENNPKVKGSAESRSTVRIYKSAGCSGPVAAEGAAAAFESPGLAVAVADNETVSLTATATDAAGNTSLCSGSVSYTESTPPPAPSPASAAPGSAVAARVALVKGGRALLKLSCGGGGACQGSLKLIARVEAGEGARSSRMRNLTIGRARFSIAAGKDKVVRVGLTAKGKALLRKAGRRGLKAKLQGSGVQSRSLVLREKKRRH